MPVAQAIQLLAQDPDVRRSALAVVCAPEAQAPRLRSSAAGTSAGPAGSSTPAACWISRGAGVGRVHARGVTIGEFSLVFLSELVGCLVLDQTGLTGRFDFDLEWADDPSSLAGALEAQLGLRVEPFPSRD